LGPSLRHHLFLIDGSSPNHLFLKKENDQ